MIPSNNLTVAAAQFAAGTDKTANLDAVAKLTVRAADAGADLVVFPEAAMVPFGEVLARAAEPLDGPFADRVREIAEASGVAVVLGMFEPSGDGRVHNTLLATGRGAEAAYRKIHLFDAFGSRESDTVAPGSDLVTFRLGGVTVGLATCFDLRFADQFTALGRAGAELVCVPASWGDGPGKAEQWDLLTRARATDAQAWLVACDQAWVPPRGADPLGLGRSCAIDPLGRVRGRLGHEPGLLVQVLDVAEVRAVRERVPVLAGVLPSARH
ncbi:carbon-nitrogen hydrolase family protein [Sinomonas sp. B1-1]|uniref:carbon-nitrogen hydrolase family protein n=1 Tax=Sinomonas sp. B1-1 TaxID=3141454 RepID=UPI003D2C36D4